MKYWSKSALSIYRYLEKMVNTIDKIVLDTGKYSNQNIQRNQTTYYQTRKMIELIDRKRKMINLKIAVEEALGSLNKTDRRILGLAFIDGVKSELIAQFLGVSIRTFFRKKMKALENFNEQMIECGFDLQFFETEYSTEKWLLSVYDEVLSKCNKEEDSLDKVVVKRVLNEISQIEFAYNSFIC